MTFEDRAALWAALCDWAHLCRDRYPDFRRHGGRARRDYDLCWNDTSGAW